jgi:hypothetical protein
MYFLNLLPTDKFMAVMDEMCSYRHLGLAKDEANSDGMAWLLENRIRISFTEGDPSNYDTLERVMMKEQHGFDVALVVPPVDSAMSSQAQDTRLMTIMCALRSICEHNNLPPIHVVGENKLESSAGLALRPKTHESIDETDFVNVQAIIARTLCQAMAFPFMQPAVVQLFESTEGTPAVYMVQASLFVPLNYEILFSDLIEEVKEECKDHICIGYRLMLPHEVKQILCPKLNERVSFKEQDSLVIISRQTPGVKTSRSPNEAQKLANSDASELARVNDSLETSLHVEEIGTSGERFLLPQAINS